MFKSDSPFVGGVCGGARFSVNQNKTSLKNSNLTVNTKCMFNLVHTYLQMEQAGFFLNMHI